MRASVHIHLPYLGKNKKEFQAIADKFHVQIRGAHGEHTETDDHIYDLSNKRRLGRSEVDLVQDMYDGVTAMIAKEKELRPAEPKPEPKAEPVAAPVEEAKPEPVAEAKSEPIKCGPHLKKPEDLTGFPTFPEGTKSLVSKFVTEAVWEELKDKVDD